MLEGELAALAQLGAAGLMGWMWLSERRGAAARERQLSESHERIVQERRYFESLLEAVRENTRVLALVESGQQRLGRALEGLGEDRAAGARTGGQDNKIQG
jgi:hypothetical protein